MCCNRRVVLPTPRAPMIAMRRFFQLISLWRKRKNVVSVFSIRILYVSTNDSIFADLIMQIYVLTLNKMCIISKKCTFKSALCMISFEEQTCKKGETKTAECYDCFHNCPALQCLFFIHPQIFAHKPEAAVVDVRQ